MFVTFLYYRSYKHFGVISNPPTPFFHDDEEGNPLNELCAIALTADNSMVNGDYDISIEDIKFILPNSFAYIPESTFAAKLNITGGQEGSVEIADIVGESKEPIYYDLSGRAVKNLTRGIYVKENKKVIVK